MKNLTDVLKEAPHQCDFAIGMVADSTTEVWKDITTHLRHGDAWLIVALLWYFENKTPTVPLGLISSAATQHALQIHKNTDHETQLGFHDPDLLLHSGKMLTNNYIDPQVPFRHDCRVFTTQPRLRAIFRTGADNTSISATTVQVVGRILYHPLNGPSGAGYTKHGLMKEL